MTSETAPEMLEPYVPRTVLAWDSTGPHHRVVQGSLVSADISDFENTTDPEYFGKGTMVLTNLTDEAQKICLPYATAFKDEENAAVQDMAVYPDQQPDPKDLEEPELLPESGGPDAPNTLLAALLPVAALLVGGLDLLLRRRSRAKHRLD